MNTRDILLHAALKLLEEEGEANFTTRKICAIASVTAPTLYHHFGNADGLLSAAIAEAFAQFLESKRTAAQSTDPVMALREGWDDYVRFAAARPRLYAVMMSRVLDGADIPAAGQAFALLIARLEAVATGGRLGPTIQDAADLMWASANAASQLHVTARLRKVKAPTPAVLERIREDALRSILNSETDSRSR